MSRPDAALRNLLRFRVGGEHPALPGHFPGRPIVPGVLLLDAVLQALRETGAGWPLRLLRAKFLAPVLPGTEVEIALSARVEGPGRFTFTCRVDGGVVLTGEIACATPRPPPA